MSNVQKIFNDGMGNTGRKPSGKVIQVKGANVPDRKAEEARLNLSQREEQAAKSFLRINGYAKRSLSDLASIGQVILDKRKACGDNDKAFSKAIESSPLKVISYQQRKVLQDFAEFWTRIEQKIKTDPKNWTSTSPDTLVRQIKAELQTGKKRGANPPKGDKGKDKAAKNGVTKAQILQMIQLGLDSGVITTKDLKGLKPTKK